MVAVCTKSSPLKDTKAVLRNHVRLLRLNAMHPGVKCDRRRRCLRVRNRGTIMATAMAVTKEGVKEKLLTALQSHAASAEGDLQMYMAKKYVTAEQKAVLQQLIIDFFANVPGANAPEKLGKWLQARQCPASGVVSKDVNRHILSMGYVH